MQGHLTSETVIRRCGTPLSTEVDGETLLMSVESGRYYGLDEVGSDVWRRLDKPASVAALCLSLGQVYDGDADQIERDVIALLVQLHAEGLIEVVG